VSRRSIPRALGPLAIVLLVLAATAAAQSPRPRPRLHHAFPPGGRAGGVVEVAVAGESIEAADGLWFSHPGLVATPEAGRPGTFRVAIAADVPPGNHDVRALTPEGVSNPRTFVVGRRPESTEAEPNDTPVAANPVVINSVVNGVVGRADVDCFAFDGEAGRRLFLDLAAERIESRLDATIRLLDARGVEVAESRDSYGADPFLDVTLPASGRYVVKVHDVTFAGSADHVYRLGIDDGPRLDSAFPAIAEPGPSSHHLTLIGRKLDGAALPGVGPDRLAFESRGWDGPTPFRPASDLTVNVLGAAAAVRAFSLGLGADGRLSNPTWIVESPGPIVAEREPNSPESPQDVAPPCSIGGDFRTRNDLDAYRFRAKKGEVWRIEAVAEGIGSPADPTFVVQRLPEKGEPQDVASADDTADPGLAPRFNLASTDATLRWQVPADGTYQVVLNDVAGTSRAGPRLSYRLSVRPEHPDFRLFLVPDAVNALDAVTVRRGGRAAAMLLAWRLDGFAAPILVRPESLPEGLRCDPVIIPAGRVSAPVVFEAAGAAGPSVGVVRLVGSVGATPGTQAGTDPEHVAIPGSLVWPPSKVGNVRATVAPSRATRGFVVAVREGSPFLLTARPRRRAIAVGQDLDLDLTLGRSSGFDGAVAVSGWELPAGFPGPALTIPKGTTSAVLPWTTPPGLPPGDYSLVLKGSSTVTPGPTGRAGYRAEEPSNPVLVSIRPAPVRVTLPPKPAIIKRGGTVEVVVGLERLGGFAGPLHVVLDPEAADGLDADPQVVPPGRASATLSVRAKVGGPVGPAHLPKIRVEADVAGEKIEVVARPGLAIEAPGPDRSPDRP